MTHATNTKRFLPVLGLASALAAAGAFGAEETVRKTFTVHPGGRLTMDVDRGSIEIDTQPGGTVRIEVAFRREGWSGSKLRRFIDDFGLDFSQSGDAVTVRTGDGWDDGGSWFSGRRNPDVHFHVTVPPAFDAELRTSGGSIRVGDLQGRVTAKTSGGSLDFGNIRGTVLGKTSGGSIRIGDCSGDLDVHTSGGGIRVGHTNGSVQARTSGGSIELEAVDGAVTAQTSGGSIHASLTKSPSADCLFETSGGGITVSAPADLKADLDAQTSGGRVSTDFPVTVTGELNPQKLFAEINGGGPRLTLRTSGGGIRLEKRP
jgi:hypothetical protein